jgi:hypothetical protein
MTGVSCWLVDESQRGKTKINVDLIRDLMRISGPLDPDASSSEMWEVGKVTFDQKMPMTE